MFRLEEIDHVALTVRDVEQSLRWTKTSKPVVELDRCAHRCYAALERKGVELSLQSNPGQTARRLR